MARFISTLMLTTVLLFIASLVLMLSWNAVIPSLFSLRELDFAGAFALLVTVLVISRVAAPSRPETPPVVIGRIPVTERKTSNEAGQ